jgi:hypothetical protein
MTGNGGNPCSLALEKILKEKREKQEKAMLEQKTASQVRKEPKSAQTIKLKRLASGYETSYGRSSQQVV